VLSGPVADGRFALRLKVDLRGETQLATQRMSEALDLYSARRYGDFLAAARQVLPEFPFANEATRRDLRAKIDEVDQACDRESTRVDGLVRDYLAFKDREDLLAARRGLEGLRERYQLEPGKGQRGEHYQRTKAEVDRLDLEARQQMQGGQAEAPFVRATLVDMNEVPPHVHSAALQLFYVVKILPHSKQAEAAQAELNAIRAKHPEVIAVLEKLFGPLPAHPRND
jgi:hypothetical protein